MFVRNVSVCFTLWTSTVLVTLSQGTNAQTTSLDLLIPSNEDPNTLSVGGLDIRCDGTKYGFNPSFSDCESARSSIAPDSRQFAFGERHTGLSEDVVLLPDMFMGEKAECWFQPIIVGDAVTGRASLNQIRTAASALLMRCASNYPSQGGIVTNIGGDNNMAVTMGVFNASKIQCRGTSGRLRSCLEVLSHMPASTTLEVFGPPGTPFVKEVLPLEIVSEDEQCVLKLYSTGRPDVLAWYRVWEAAEAVAALCGKDARGGSYRGLGVQGNVFMTFGGRPPSISMGNSSDDAATA